MLDEDLLRRDILFVCFVDPDGHSPTSEGGHTFEPHIEELRCPHFRNKCGIKRLIQTSKIGYSTFMTASEANLHNLTVQNEYKFKCEVTRCRQRFKTKQQL